MALTKSLYKKIIMILMAVIMSLSVFTMLPNALPEASAASAGKYYIRVTWQVTNDEKMKGSFHGTCNDEEDSAGFFFMHKAGNGTAETSEKPVVDITGKMRSKSGYTETLVLAGFPVSMTIYLNNNGGTTAGYKITNIEIGSSFSNMTSMWSGTVFMESTARQKKATIDIDRSKNTSNDSKYAKITEGTRNWSMPSPKSIEWDNSAVTKPVPSEYTTGKATVKDQYGVTWKDAPKYSLSADPAGRALTGITYTSGAGDTCTVTADDSARDYIGKNSESRKVYLKAWINSVSSSVKTITYTNISYNVRFLNGDGSVLTSGTYLYGSIPECTKTPEKAATKEYKYTFTGWSPKISEVTKDVTYTPLFSRTPIEYKISFSPNGGTGSMAEVPLNYDISVTLPVNSFKRTGYSFSGWATSPAGNVQYGDRAVISKTAQNLMLYAVWTANTYKINILGGTETKVINAVYDREVIPESPVKPGHRLKGFALTEGGETVYNPGAAVKNLAESGEVNLYAVWIMLPSENVIPESQSLVLDFGLPVEYNLSKNNKIPAGAKTEYVGTAAVNAIPSDLENMGRASDFVTKICPAVLYPVPAVITKNEVSSLHGSFSLDKNGNTVYKVNDMNFTSSDYFYVVVRISGDPTYEPGTVYYTYEKVSFIPATSIYYEDNFGSTVITYSNGEGSSKYGKWITEGASLSNMKQAADLAGDPDANVYGHDSNITGSTYSAGSAHFVQVSEKNNPGRNGKYPKAKFTFTGTGFDVISLTDNRTGASEVRVYRGEKAEGKILKKYIIDTYYGYTYGRLYMDKEGNPTLVAENNIPMYKSLKGVCTKTPMFYDEQGNLTQKYSENPAYAYGWVLNPGSTEALYQIPVIKSDVFDYGTYTVEIIPSFTKMFGHYDTDAEGERYYGFCLDGIRIYNPAVSSDKEAQNAYNSDKEANPEYMEVRDLIIAANKTGGKTEGMIFIDGAPACNDIEMYKNAGPKNELYLKKGQAIAFELVAEKIPADVQIGAKLIKGMPALAVSKGSFSGTQDILTANDMYFSFEKLLPSGGGLKWTAFTDESGKTQYKTETITIQNNSEGDSVLSLTNIKWTYETVMPRPMMMRAMVSPATAATAMTAVNMLKADLSVKSTAEPECKNGSVIFKLVTSEDVKSLVLRDENGNPVTPGKISSALTEKGREWTVEAPAGAAGKHTYYIFGVYENGYSDSEKALSISFETEKKADIPCVEGFCGLAELIKTIIEIILKLLSLFEI